MARIAPLIAGRENRRLLSEWCEEFTEHSVVSPPPPEELDAASYDICIVDGTTLERHAELIDECKRAAEPVFLPTLCLISRRDAFRMEPSVWEHADDVVWGSVEESINAPIAKSELRVRIKSLLGLRETTQQIQAKNDELRLRGQQFAVLSRFARHNIRNDTNIIQGNVRVVLDAIDDEFAESLLEQAASTSEELHRTSENVQTIAHYLDPTTAVMHVDAHSLFTRCKREAEERFEEATIACALPEREFRVPVRLGPVIQTLIEHACTAADDEVPHVTVSVTAPADSSEPLEIVVTDTGPPLPRIEQVPFEDVEETALEHASGIGLWLVVWLIRDMGGTVTVEAGDAGGNRITITVPVKAP